MQISFPQKSVFTTLRASKIYCPDIDTVTGDLTIKRAGVDTLKAVVGGVDVLGTDKELKCAKVTGNGGGLEVFTIDGGSMFSTSLGHGGTSCMEFTGTPPDIIFVVDTRWKGVFMIFCDDGLVSVIEWNAAGEVTKIGQDAPAADQHLEWDGAKVIWDPA